VLERQCDDRLHPYRTQTHLLQAVILHEWHVASLVYAIFCGQAQRVLEKSVRSTSTAVSLGHDMIIIVLSSPLES
jgi:hypothetical protein